MTSDDSLAAVQDAFRQVRPLILQRAGKAGRVTDKQDGSPITDTDIEVEHSILAALAERIPDIPAFGEETGYGNNLPEAFWLIDPIDGTQDFIENVPKFTTMGVLIQNKEAVAAAIYNPSNGDMYTAQKGKGAFKNGTRLDLRTVPLPRVAWCKERFIDTLNDMLKPKGVTCEKPPRSGGFGFAKVAEGAAAARFNLHSGGYTHDYAPGALIAREAGGAIIPVQDDVYTFETRSFVACHPELEPILRPCVQELRELEARVRGKGDTP